VLAVEGRGWCGESPEEVERVVYISVVLMFTHANNLNKAADPRTLGPVSDRQDPGRTQASSPGLSTVTSSSLRLAGDDCGERGERRDPHSAPRE
jgi:hypothetical protein